YGVLDELDSRYLIWNIRFRIDVSIKCNENGVALIRFLRIKFGIMYRTADHDIRPDHKLNVECTGNWIKFDRLGSRPLSEYRTLDFFHFSRARYIGATEVFCYHCLLPSFAIAI